MYCSNLKKKEKKELHVIFILVKIYKKSHSNVFFRNYNLAKFYKNQFNSF